MNPNPKVQDLGIIERDSILEYNGQWSLALLSRWLLLKVLEVKFLKISKVVGAER
jgi:hypothetical protein